MDGSAAFVRILELVVLAGCCLTSIKLACNGLYRKYRAFFAYLVFRCFYTAALLFVFKDFRTAAYSWFWVFTEPVIWLFYVVVVIELFSLVLERHRGLYTLGRWVLYAGLSVSVLISGLALLPQLSGGTAQASRILPYYYAIERGVDFSLFLFLLLILLWLTRYPVPLSRNVLVHSLAYSALFLSNTAGVLVRTILGMDVLPDLNRFLLGIGAACILIWLLFLTPKGEEVRVNLPIFGPEHEERILNQLEALNKTLLKVSRE
jgi:hypothetical protein